MGSISARLWLATLVALLAACGPEAALSELDREQIFAAAAASGAAGFTAAENHTEIRIDVIDTIGRPREDENSMLRFPEDAQFSESQRDAIVAALAPLSVVFVPPTVYEDPYYVTYDGLAGNVVLSIGEPIKEEGEFQIVTGLWCGPLCGSGGARQLEQLENGTWTLTDPVGPQWVP